MLTDHELDASASQLSSFRIASLQQHESLTDILEKYEALVNDYKSLKSDYEEARDSRDRYKTVARTQDRNPFVLVLIDGDGYIFADDLLTDREDGGRQAATRLHEAVKRNLRTAGLDNCRVMVRVYANLAGLSKALSRPALKLAGAEKRSLGPFVAEFNRSNDMFDFVDAGEKKENADAKVRAMFRQFVDNPQCKHIYFAGCHDVGYINELTSHALQKERVSLIRHPAFHHEFSKLGMRIDDFQGIFRDSLLDSQYVNYNGAHNSNQIPSPPPPHYSDRQAGGTTWSASQHDNSAGPERQVCKHYLRGTCRFGNKCTKLHIDEQVSHGRLSYNNAPDTKTWRESGAPSNGFQMGGIGKADNDFMSSHHHSHSIGNNSTSNEATDFGSQLPSGIPDGKIAVNSRDQRLDIFNDPSPEDVSSFNSRTSRRKLCNNYHLQNNCPNSKEDCEYDHAYASEGVVAALRQIVATQPCPRRGGCRKLNCISGHLCQRADCKFRGGKVYCKFPPNAHSVDMRLAGFVQGEVSKSPGKSTSAGDRERSMTGSETPGRGSDVGEDSTDGALLDGGGDEALRG
ncbi:hypothetical protein LTR10_011209 [Elasticomyces elasticus]|nr:hypothetical protein LTR10_011209 [Elasticomyces elasticus]KAK4966371.1 hypothetical protein LTR42_011534 [Elasticomyces elasticus]